MSRTLGIYGASGCGRGIMPLLRKQSHFDDRLVFVDDIARADTINGHACLDYNSFHALEGSKSVAIAVADPAVRRQLADKCAAGNIDCMSVRSKNIVIMDDVEIGEGALLSPYIVLTSNIRIGCHFHANIHSYVEHDCTIGDFVTFAPGVRCNGNVAIENYAYIGSGAVIRQGRPGKPLTIGEGAVIGAGAVVLRDVAAGETVVGNPARVLVS